MKRIYLTLILTFVLALSIGSASASELSFNEYYNSETLFYDLNMFCQNSDVTYFNADSKVPEEIVFKAVVTRLINDIEYDKYMNYEFGALFDVPLSVADEVAHIIFKNPSSLDSYIKKNCLYNAAQNTFSYYPEYLGAEGPVGSIINKINKVNDIIYVNGIYSPDPLFSPELLFGLEEGRDYFIYYDYYYDDDLGEYISNANYFKATYPITITIDTSNGGFKVMSYTISDYYKYDDYIYTVDKSDVANTANRTCRNLEFYLDFYEVFPKKGDVFSWSVTHNLKELNFIYESSDSSICTIDQKGTVKALKNGSVSVYATIPGIYDILGHVNVLFPDVSGSPYIGDSNYQYFFTPVYWASRAGIVKGLPDGTFGTENPCTRRQFIIMLWRQSGKPEVEGDARDYFIDVPAKYDTTTDSNKAIAWAYEIGISKGYALSNGKREFRPDENILRRAVVTMLYRLNDSPEVEGDMPFKDVLESKYGPSTDTYKAILWASKKEITKGKNGNFLIDDLCKRKEVVTFLYRAYC